MKYYGTIILESLDSIECMARLKIRKRETWHPQNKADWQPSIWNVVFFENNDERIRDVINELAGCIKERWYIDISARPVKYIIFRNKIFEYDRSNTAQKVEAIEYGKKAGIPESQLDWPD